MNYLPGTTVEVNINNSAQSFLSSAFTLNGLVLSQIVQLTGLEPHTIQNWVKRKFIAPPVQKKYDCNQFCRIAMINMLKDTFHIERIVGMLDYVCSSEKAADDMLLYIVFADVVCNIPEDAISNHTDVDKVIGLVLSEKQLSEQTKERLRKVVKVMVMADISAKVGRNADALLRKLEEMY